MTNELRDVKPEFVAVDRLKAYDGNAKKHSQANIDAIANSIREFGFRQPILAWHNEDGVAEIVAGHGRAAAAKKLGMEDVPVIFVDDLDDAQRRMLTHADNQTTLMTGWDESALSFELDSLGDVFDIEDFGFDSQDSAAVTERMFDGSENFAEALDEEHQYIVIKIDNSTDWLRAQTLFDLKKGKRFATNANGSGGGDTRLNHVVKWGEFVERFGL